MDRFKSILRLIDLERFYCIYILYVTCIHIHIHYVHIHLTYNACVHTLCMYMCIYIMYIHTAHTYSCAHIHKYMHNTYIHNFIHNCIHNYIHIHTCIHAYMHTYIHTCITRTYIHIIHPHTNTNTATNSSSCRQCSRNSPGGTSASNSSHPPTLPFSSPLFQNQTTITPFKSHLSTRWPIK